MATATIQWFRINSTGRYWSARFDYANTTPGPLQVWDSTVAITISGGASACTAYCHHTKIETIDSKTVVFASGTLSRKVTYADGANLLATAASAIFTEVGGTNSAATFTNQAIESNACEDEYGAFAVPDPTGAAGIRGFAAVNPSTLTTNLWAYVDPEQEGVTADDAVVNPILDRSGNTNNMTPRSDASDARRPKFKNDIFGTGKHGYYTPDSFGGVLWGSQDADTYSICVIGVLASKGGTLPDLARHNSLNAISRTVGNTDAFSGANNADRTYAVGEPLIVAWEFKTSDNTSRRWLYGYKTGWAATAWTGTASLSLFFDASSANTFYFGKTYIWRSNSGLPLTEAEIKGSISWLMNDYSIKPRTIHVASTGNDTTGTGTSGAPYRSLSKALGVVRHGVGEHINLTYGDAYGSNTDAAFTSSKGDLDDLEGVDAHNRGWVKASGTRSNGRCVIKRTVGTIFINDSGDASYIGLHGLKIQQPDNDIDDAAYDAGGDAGGAIVLGSAGAGTHIDCIINDVHIAGAHDGITSQIYDTSPFDADGYDSVLDCSRIQTTSVWRAAERASAIFTNSLGCEFYDEVQHFTPGWIPTTDASDTLSHGQYHNYKGKGSIVIGHTLVYNASAHGLMLRAGGWMNRCYAVDCPVGFVGDQRTLKVNQSVVENGRDIGGSDRGWAIWCGNGDWQDISENVVIPGDGYTGDYAIRFGSTGYATQPAQAYYTSSASWRVDIRNNTVATYPVFAMYIDNEEGADIDSLNFERNVFVQGAQYLINSLLTSVELAAITISANYNCRYSSQATPNLIDAVTKTEAEMVTALGETNLASTNTTFATGTRDIAAWMTDLENTSKTTANCKAVLIAAHLGGWNNRYSTEALVNWVARGYEPTNLNAASFNNDYVGAVDWTADGEWPNEPAPATAVVVLNELYTEALINWTLSATSGVVRYIVRYGLTAGALNLEDDSDDVGTAIFIDSGDSVGYWSPTGLTPGSTYYFEVVAVNPSGVESNPTTEDSFTLLSVETVDGDRIYGTTAINSIIGGGSAVDWVNPGNVNGAASGDYANASVNNQTTEALTCGVPATAISGTIIAMRLGFSLRTAAAPGAGSGIGAVMVRDSGGTAIALGFADQTISSASLTEYELDLVMDTGTWAGLKAAIAAGITAADDGGVAVGMSIRGGATGATDFRVEAMWIQPVLAGESGGDSPTGTARGRDRSRGRAA